MPKNSSEVFFVFVISLLAAGLFAIFGCGGEAAPAGSGASVGTTSAAPAVCTHVVTDARGNYSISTSCD